jgi:hypothetical protein
MQNPYKKAQQERFAKHVSVHHFFAFMEVGDCNCPTMLTWQDARKIVSWYQAIKDRPEQQHQVLAQQRPLFNPSNNGSLQESSVVNGLCHQGWPVRGFQKAIHCYTSTGNTLPDYLLLIACS